MRVSPYGDIRYEDAQLLDPIDKDDPVLLSFNVEGRAIPAALLTDAWEKARVKYSVERYNLDFPPLMDKRNAVWAECWNRVQEYLKELKTYHDDKPNVIARDRSKQTLKRVRELMHEERELSAVARACILSSGDPRVTGILQSAWEHCRTRDTQAVLVRTDGNRPAELSWEERYTTGVGV